MSMTDPIADFLARIRNGIRARKQLIELPALEHEAAHRRDPARRGFCSDVSSSAEDKKQGMLKLELRYDGRTARNAITGMRRVSRPGQRHYVPAKDVPKVRNGLGIAILSTSQGVMTDKEARNKGVGGEVLCEVW